ncbi:hypothetical protein BB14905_08178 [Bacillus sp. B14905]|nr:hypothetical protein BB14905_08178 [Bacillus sp. B14905]
MNVLDNVTQRKFHFQKNGVTMTVIKDEGTMGG